MGDILLKQSNDRYILFDNMKGLLIFLVVFGHSLEYFRMANPVAKWLYIFIYLFHMPVFVFVSGYFSKNLQKGRETAVTSFLVPFLLLNTILSIGLLLNGKIDQFTILNPGWTLWYFYTMFIWRLLLPDLVRIKHVVIASLIAGILAGFVTEFGTFMALARTLRFSPYFLAGYYTNEVLVNKIRALRWNKILSGVILLLVMLIASLWLYLRLPPELLWGDRAFGFFKLPLYQNILLGIGEYIIGFAFVFVLISLTSAKQHFFTQWGQNTLSIYLLHIYLIGPLLYLSESIKQPLVHFFVLFSGSIITSYVLSRAKVSAGVKRMLTAITNFIMRSD